MGNSLTIKRMASPVSWKMEKKKHTFVTKPHPGAHTYKLGTSLTVILREMLKVAHTAREARYILQNKEVMINGARRKDGKFLTGFMDTLSFVPLDEHYRIIMTTNGMLSSIKITADDAKKKLAKIIGKKLIKGKLQLNLSDGRNVFVEKDVYTCGDSLLFEVPSQKIVHHLKLEKKAAITLTAGTHIGKIGTVEDIVGDIILFKVNDNMFRTKKEFAFVLGAEQPMVTMK